MKFKPFAVLGLALLSQAAFASVEPEMEGMESVSRDDGTFLVAGPTYAFDRILGAGGLHSESELWTPAKLRQRLLFNRMSVLPSWDPMAPSVWVKTGNELGDMIYQDLITEKDRPVNRTPILEAGFRTPSFLGFWATARGFQDDHYSARTRSLRKKLVDDEFSLFGENWPMFSSGYAGLGFTNDLVNASALVGEEYLWMFSESGRWIPVHYNPRIEGRLDVWNFSATVAYENAEYQNRKFREKGDRKEWNGSVLYSCGESCQKGMLQLSAGLAFRAVEDSGTVYTKLENDRVLWPFMELRVQPAAFYTADVMFGMNDRDWMVLDSMEFGIPVPKSMNLDLGVKHLSATRLNPLADTKEFFNGDTISLTADGADHLIQGYARFADTLGSFGFGARASYWAEYGAETFDASSYEADGVLEYRHGDVARIDDWIHGVTGELWFGAWYKDMFAFLAQGGYEYLKGPVENAEVNPTEFFLSFSGDWLMRKSFRMSHSIRYRSDARWNLRSKDPMVIKGDWYWDATFEQQFPKQGLYLTGTLVHVLADERIQVPNGDYDRIRFICSVKKTF